MHTGGRHNNENPLRNDLLCVSSSPDDKRGGSGDHLSEFETDTIACNDNPHNSCSSRASLPGVIVGDYSGG